MKIALWVVAGVLVSWQAAVSQTTQDLSCATITLWPDNVGSQPTWTNGTSNFGPTVNCCGPDSTPDGIQNTEIGRAAAQAYCSSQNYPWYGFNIRLDYSGNPNGNPYLDITCCLPPQSTTQIDAEMLTFMDALMSNAQLRDQFSDDESLNDILATAQSNGYPISASDIPGSTVALTERVLSACGGAGMAPCETCTESVTVYFPLNFCCVPMASSCVQSSYSCNSGLQLSSSGVCTAPPPPSSVVSVLWWDGTPAANLNVVVNTSVYPTDANGQFTLKPSDSPPSAVTIKLLNSDIFSFSVQVPDQQAFQPTLQANRQAKSLMYTAATPSSAPTEQSWPYWRTFFYQVNQATQYFRAQAQSIQAGNSTSAINYKIRVNVQTSTTGQTYYNPPDNTMYINYSGNQALPATVTFHEYGHKVMQEVYGTTTYLQGSNCATQHYIGTAVDPVCAFIEGWADFFAVAALGVNNFTYRNGATSNLELYPSKNNSLSDEGRVAAALLDVYDSANDSGYGNASYQDANPGCGMSDMLSKLSLLQSKPASACSGGNCLNITDFSSMFAPVSAADGASWSYNYVTPPAP